MNFLQKIIDHENLTFDETTEIMKLIMDGKLSDVKIAAFLSSLQTKGPTADEIAACAKTMQEFAVTINPNVPLLVDTCGTGGDNRGTFNVSTTVAFVVAGAGCYVGKHGNRAASSKSGSADVLTALGVKIDLEPSQVEKCIEKTGIGFLFAPTFHPAMKAVVPVRKELGIKTIFNLLGPLTNPAHAKHQVVGVYDAALTEIIAEVLSKIGIKHALVVHGEDIDEITVSGKTKITEMENGKLTTFFIQPDDFGFKKSQLQEIKGGTPEENAAIALAILKGEDLGAKRDIVLLNAAAALIAAEKAKSFTEGIKLAIEALDNGSALKKLEELKSFTNQVQLP